MMTEKHRIAYGSLSVAAIILLAVTFSGLFIAPAGTINDGEGAHGSHQEVEKGPHGGRMLGTEDGFALEITIFEPGIPPQSRVYPFFNGVALSPDQVNLVLELHRFDRVDTINYSAQGAFLFGDRIVAEPHSFDVKVRANHKGKDYAWEYDTYEGRVEITAESAKLSGIGLEKVESRQLVDRLPVLGQVGFNQDTVNHVSARYSGAVISLSKRIGDYVKKGETVAVILGTESLSEFRVHAPGSGHVVEQQITVGETVNAGQIMFAIADLSTVWVDFTVYRTDASRVAPKQRVEILPLDGTGETEGIIAYFAPVGDGPSQSVTARSVVKNPNGILRPGLFVNGQIEVGRVDAKTVVRREAVQTFRDWNVVFRNRGSVYEIAVVELGLVDGDYVQVLSGLSPGQSYVAKNSFIVKADVGKSGATHDH
jgi:cobalt-zinc-cadmium efflux system membrane fusion protein